MPATQSSARPTAARDGPGSAFPPRPPVGTSGSEILAGGLTAVSCPTASNCTAAGPAGVVATSNGTDWRLQARTKSAGEGGPVSGGILFGQFELIACLSARHCIAALSEANGSRFVTSDDGGRSWTRVGPSLPYSIEQLTCPTRSECLASATDRESTAVVLQSFDGGWRFRRAPLPPLAIGATGAGYVVACAGARDCLALGAGASGVVAVGH